MSETSSRSASNAGINRPVRQLTRWTAEESHLAELVKYRYLLQNLIIRDLKVRYKNSVLGVLWSLLNPLAMMLVFWVVFTILIPGNNIRQYGVFILVGILPWSFFNNALISGTVSITSNSHLLKKIYFPRELLPVAAVLANLINFLMAIVVLFIFLYGSGLGITRFALWAIPILFTQVIFLLGLSLLLSALHVFYRDVMMILDVGLLAWFFLTPIFYSFDQFPQTATAFGISFNPVVVMRWLNPMASIIDGYRTVLWGSADSFGPVSMDPIFLLRTFVTSVLIFGFGYWVFMRLQTTFGERL